MSIIVGLMSFCMPIHAMQQWFKPTGANWYDGNPDDEEQRVPLHVEIKTANDIEAKRAENADTEKHNPFPFPWMLPQQRFLYPLTTTEHYVCTPLHHAVKTGDIATVQQLLEQGQNPNIPDTRDLHPFYYACMGKNPKNQPLTIRELYLSGADDPSLELANLRDDILATILSADRELCAHIQTSLKTSLDLFIPEALTQLVIEYDEPTTRFHSLKARHHVTDSEKKSLLHSAASCNDIGKALRAFYLGVNIEAKDEHGRTALHLTALHSDGNTAIADLLLKNNAPIKSTDNDGQTPLHIAVINGNTGVASLLLTHNASPFAQDNHNQTPLQIAEWRGETKIVQLISTH